MVGASTGFAAGDANAGKTDGTAASTSKDAKAPAKATAPPGNKYWLAAKEEVARTVLELLAQHREEMRKGFKYHKIIRGDQSQKMVALTFDDGPHPKWTPSLLALLNKCQVKATFFVTGEMAAKYPELIKAEIAAGHNVGNHTFHHVNLTKIPEELIPVEIKACGEVIRGITGKSPHLFRPPGGSYNKDVADAAEVLGYTTVLWTDNPGDYEKPKKEVIQTRLLKHIANGAIILVHDGIPETMDALPAVIQAWKDKGYTFVTMDEMLQRTKNPPPAKPAAVPPVKKPAAK